MIVGLIFTKQPRLRCPFRSTAERHSSSLHTLSAQTPKQGVNTCQMARDVNWAVAATTGHISKTRDTIEAALKQAETVEME